MKITDVTLTLFAWDDIPPTQYGQHSRFAGSSALGLLRIATDEGVEGHAFLGSASNSATTDGQGLITHLKPVLMGRNPLHREALVVDLWKKQRVAGVRTIGAVDVALWDLLGKAVGQPIHRLLGTYREAVPAYASSAVLASPAAYAEEAQKFKEHGWAAYKIHPPTRWKEDIKVCEAVRKAVGEMIKMGVDWVKCMASIEWSKAAGEPISAVNMSPELMHEAFDIAHHHGKRCMVHAVCNDSIVNSLDAGADSIEHGVMLDETTAERMAREEVFLVPTLSGWRERCNDWGRDAGHVRHAELMRPHHDKSVRIACSIGLKMAYGSDNFGNLPDEVRGLHDAGLSLSECLVVATRNGAELLGIQDKVGTIEKGKQADMVVLGKDPLSSFEAYRDIRLVFRDGRKIDPTLLPI